MTAEEIFNIYVEKETVNPSRTGGQTCGTPQQKVRLKLDYFNLVVEIGTYRSQIKNFELAKEIMLLLIDEVKNG